MPLMEVWCQNKQGCETIYSLIGINYGFLADIDINSEFLRFLGNLRFEIYSYFKVFNPDSFNVNFFY